MEARPPRCPPQIGSEPELLARLEGADREAFDVLFERYFSCIYHYFACQCERVPDAEWATEAALLSIFRAISDGRSQLPLPRWIFRSVRAVRARRLESPLLPGAVSA